MTKDQAKYPVQTGEKMLSIIEALEELEQARITELADELKMSKSTVHNHLSTLKEHEYVVQQGDFYQLSLRFLALGEVARGRTDLYKFGQPRIDNLAEETGELVNLTYEENGYVVYIYRKRGTENVQFSTEVGRREYMHCTAVGKAILAHLPDNRVEEIVEMHGLPKQTENTLVNPDELYEELAEIQDSGIAHDREEFGEGLRCIATPIIGPADQVLGGISISAPTTRLNNDAFEKRTVNLLEEAANIIELNIRNY